MRRSVMKCVLLALLLLKLCPNTNEASFINIQDNSFLHNYDDDEEEEEEEEENEDDPDESENDPEQYYPVYESMKGISDSPNEEKSDKEVNEEEGEEKKREVNEGMEEQEEQKEEEEEAEEEKKELEEGMKVIEIGEEEEATERENVDDSEGAENLVETAILEYFGLNENDNHVISGANEGKIKPDEKINIATKDADNSTLLKRYHERKQEEEEEGGEDEVAVKDLQFLPGRLNLGLKGEEREAKDCFECWKIICKKDKNCVVSFDKSFSRCVSWKVGAQVVSWDQMHRKLFRNVKFEIESWVTILMPPKNVEVPPPRLMWLMDQMAEDRNFVQSEKQMLGLSTTPISSNLNATLPYIRLSDKGERFSMGLLNFDEVQFNFSSPLTITTWIKTGFKGYMRIFDGIPHGYPILGFGIQSGDSSKFGVFKYEPTPKRIFTTSENDENINSWRHISVVQRSLTDVIFYLNGHPWQTNLKKQVSKFNITDSKFDRPLWNQFLSERNCHGSMACFLMFQGVLQPDHIRHVMKNCP